MNEVQTEVDVADSDSMETQEKELAEEKLKLATEEAKVAKAKELLAAMNFEGQLAKLQVGKWRNIGSGFMAMEPALALLLA